jgi:RES domain-containing protein
LIRAWRLVAAAYADRIMSGGGAYRHGGRWNSQGSAVVYMSESLSLCVLENLVHMVKLPMMRSFKSIWADIPESLIHTLEKKDLPTSWKAIPASEATKQIGDKWFDEKITAVMKVPSTVVEGEWNYVIDPAHPDFNKMKIGKIRDFEFDERLYA